MMPVRMSLVVTSWVVYGLRVSGSSTVPAVDRAALLGRAARRGRGVGRDRLLPAGTARGAGRVGGTEGVVRGGVEHDADDRRGDAERGGAANQLAPADAAVDPGLDQVVHGPLGRRLGAETVGSGVRSIIAATPPPSHRRGPD
jgi:hypothetical protein